MTIVTVANGDTCTFPGTYSQRGHFGRSLGNYVCTSGASGTFDFYEMIHNFSDFRTVDRNHNFGWLHDKGLLDRPEAAACTSNELTI